MSNKPNLYFGSTLLNPDTSPVSLETVTFNNETYFKIENYDKMNSMAKKAKIKVEDFDIKKKAKEYERIYENFTN